MTVEVYSYIFSICSIQLVKTIYKALKLCQTLAPALGTQRKVKEGPFPRGEKHDCFPIIFIFIMFPGMKKKKELCLKLVNMVYLFIFRMFDVIIKKFMLF